MRPSCRPHYACCPYVFCLSVCPVRLVSRKQNVEKSKLANFYRVTSKWDASFQLKRSKMKVSGRRKPQQSAACLSYTCMFIVYLRAATTAVRRRLQTIVRPNLLSAPDMLGNWADGRVSCRQSAPTYFLFQNV